MHNMFIAWLLDTFACLVRASDGIGGVMGLSGETACPFPRRECEHLCLPALNGCALLQREVLFWNPHVFRAYVFVTNCKRVGKETAQRAFWSSCGVVGLCRRSRLL
jgi:hypothetical protein